MLSKKNTKENKFSVFQRLFSYLKEHRMKLAIAIFLSIISNVFLLLGPIIIGLCIDAAKNGPGLVDFDSIYYYSGILFFLFISSSILNYILSLIMVSISQNISYRMRTEAFEKMEDLPIDYFNENQTGDLISRITYDIETINSSLANDSVQIFTTLITVTGSFIMMLLLSPYLALVFSITIPFAFFFAKHKTKKLHPLYKKRSQSLGNLNSFIEEKISGYKTIKIYNQQIKINSEFTKKNKAASEAAFDADYYSATVQPTMNMFNNISLALTGIVGAILYLIGSLSLGSISSFILYSRKFSGPINEAANILNDLQSSIAAAERVFKLIDEKIEFENTLEKHSSATINENIEFQNLSFSYLENKAVLKNINFKIRKGLVVALVGPTGSGKTTILNLLLRFYDPKQGTISFDKKNIKNIHKKNLRSLYSIVFQESWIFHGTIFENIRYGNNSASMNDVVQLCKSLGIHDFIMALPKGYETNLIEDRLEISQGQKQLLAIARAFLVPSEILILDEATSNIDTKTEELIQDALNKLKKNKTCFIIAHRLSTIKNADIILLLQKGEIVEQGQHDELIARRGHYYNLYNSQ